MKMRKKRKLILLSFLINLCFFHFLSFFGFVFSHIRERARKSYNSVVVDNSPDKRRAL